MQTDLAPDAASQPTPHPKGTLGFRGPRQRIQPGSMISGSTRLGKFTPTSLPYARDALVPQISRETMDYHYEKHFVGYVDKLNALIGNTEFESMVLEEVIRQAAWKRKRAIQSNAAQIWNHAFFWKSLSAQEGQKPESILLGGIVKQFGSLKEFQDKFVEKGAAHLGSGWLWLIWDKHRGLMITTTANANPVWLGTDRVPLLVCDLWEHAYYLDWRNDRAGWVHAFITERANWAFAGEQLAALLKGEPQWSYSYEHVVVAGSAQADHHEVTKRALCA